MVAAKQGQRIALDANFLVAARRRGASEARLVERWLQLECHLEISAIAWSEYLCGPVSDDELAISRRILTRVEPFTEPDAALAGRLFNETGRRSRSHADCMIAAHAVRREAALATLNLRDFRPFESFNLQLLAHE